MHVSMILLDELYANMEKLRVVWTEKGLRRDKRKTLARPSLTLNIFQVNSQQRLSYSTDSTFKNS